VLIEFVILIGRWTEAFISIDKLLVKYVFDSRMQGGGQGGTSWHIFYIVIFHIFSVLANLNIRAQLGSDTLGLQSVLSNFHAICK
jgi:hypothetical protein